MLVIHKLLREGHPNVSTAEGITGSSGYVKVMCACCCHNKKSDITVVIYIHVCVVMVIVLGHVYSMFIFLKTLIKN